MSHLPYITHCQGDKPFNIVHADMPFNDNELLKRIRGNKLRLSDDENIMQHGHERVMELQ